ncbi:hypothetical protein Tco_1512032, partial [Tanacetum coccineum]
METHVDDLIKNWVTDHVTQVTNEFIQKFDTVNTNLNNILSEMHFLVTYVNRLKGNEGTSRFSSLDKLEFSKFYGDDVQGWLSRVKQFFAIDNVHDEDKVKIMLVYFYDKELAWSLQFIKAHGDTMFEQLLTQVDITKSQSNIMFIAGLHASMEINVKMFRPKTLADAFSLANFQEASLVVIRQKTVQLLPTPKVNTSKNMSYLNRTNTLALLGPNTLTVTKHPASNNHVPRKQLSQKEFAEKRAKNLCFYCDQKYMPGHKCGGHMYALEISPLDEDSDLSLEETLNEVDTMTAEESELLMSDCYPHISLNALSGIPTFNTMRMKASVAKHILHLLLDTGSTHNFLELFIANKIGCKMKKTCPLHVIVVGGNKLVIAVVVRDFYKKFL